MVKVGVIGLGVMGTTHLDAYGRIPGARVVAVADTDPDRRAGRSAVQGNVKGQAQGGFDFASVKQYADGMDLIRDGEVDMVDVCLATPLHLSYALAAIEAGKHLLIEKPLARTADDADRIAAAAKTSGVIAMPAMCMRFWPGWTFLKAAIDDRRFGKILALHLQRIACHPGGRFYADGAACGGGILDLHLHDTDFIHHCFGRPKAVASYGYTKISGQIDHVFTHYAFDDIPLVTAEGGWVMQDGFPFTMRYCANFEKATATFDLAQPERVMLYVNGKPPETLLNEPGMGYEREIAYMIECVQQRRQPTTVTLAQAADAVRTVEAEVRSIATGRAVALPGN